MCRPLQTGSYGASWLLRERDTVRELDAKVIGTCAQCGEPILACEEYCDLGGILLHYDGDCPMDWVRRFKVNL